MFPIEHSLFGTINYQIHHMRRGALNQFFSMQRVRQLQPMVQERVDTLINRMLDCQITGEITQTENAFAAMANDNVMQYSFGRHEYRIEAPSFDPTFSNTSCAAAHSLTLWKFFRLVLTLIMSLSECVLKRLRDGVAGTIILTPSSNKSKPLSSCATLFHEILSSKLPEQEKSTLHLTDEAELLVGAGTEMTGWTFSIAVFHLLDNQTILRTLEELKTVDSESLAQTPFATLQPLPYLAAIVNEFLRLSYGIAQCLQRVFLHLILFEPSNGSDASRNCNQRINPRSPPQRNYCPASYAFKPERRSEDPGLARYQMAFSGG
ncbi:hypothetical protein IFR05_003389 [Cadophora sp. M221]|nr:hypothetical protein IFR05_003389 [Cadophora sp. M221]